MAVHPGLVDTLLARGYFRQMAPAALRPLTDPFFDRAFCPHALRRCGCLGRGVRACGAGAVCSLGVLGLGPGGAGVPPPLLGPGQERAPPCLPGMPRCQRRPLTSTSTRCPLPARSPEAAARTVLYAATAPAEEVGGRYVGTAPKVSRHSRAADDPALAARLWDLSAHLCGLEGGDDLVR